MRRISNEIIINCLTSPFTEYILSVKGHSVMLEGSFPSERERTYIVLQYCERRNLRH